MNRERVHASGKLIAFSYQPSYSIDMNISESTANTTANQDEIVNSPTQDASLVPPVKQRSSKKKYWIVGSSLLLTCLLLVGACYWFMVRNNQDEQIAEQTGSSLMPTPQVPAIRFDQLLATPTASVTPTPTISSPSIDPSALFKGLSRATLPTASLQNINSAEARKISLQNYRLRRASIVLASDPAELPVYGWNNPIANAMSSSLASDREQDRKVILSMAAHYGLTLQDRKSEVLQPSTTYAATFSKNGKEYEFPDVRIGTPNFRAALQKSGSFTMTKDQAAIKAKEYVSVSGLAYPNIDWDNAVVGSLFSQSGNGSYMEVVVPVHLGSYKVLSTNIADDIRVLFNNQGVWQVQSMNGTVFNTYPTYDTYPLITFNQARDEVAHMGGYLNCVDLESSSLGDASSDYYNHHCNHVATTNNNNTAFGNYGGVFQDVSLARVELVYAKLPNPDYSFDKPTSSAYYFLPVYRFTGSAIANYDLTKTTPNSAGQPTNEWSRMRDGKRHLFSMMVPAVKFD